MIAPRRKHVVALPDSHEISGWTGLVQKYLNTALTVVLLIAAVVMFIQWRVRAAALARQALGNELSNARSLVGDLQQLRLPFGRPPAQLLSAVNSIQNGANASISNVLNNPKADERLRAQALLLRGDLYWELANFPALPGATTQPSLQLSESSDTLLQKAWDSYQEIIKNSTYAGQHEELDGAHLGLAAIAENRGDWTSAKSELDTVLNDPAGLTVLVSVARLQLAQLPDIQKKMFIAPPTGIGALAEAPIGPPAPAATTQNFLPPGLLAPATQPTKP